MTDAQLVALMAALLRAGDWIAAAVWRLNPANGEHPTAATQELVADAAGLLAEARRATEGL